MDIALACLDLPFGLALCAGRLDQLVQSGRVLHVSSLLILRPAAECPPRSLSSRVTDHTPSGLGSQSASHMSISVTLPPPPWGLSLHCSRSSYTKDFLSSGSLVFALAIHFGKAAQKQSDAGYHFLSLRGLAEQEQGLLEGLALHNELSLKVHFHILAAIRQCDYISMGFKCSNADTCSYSLYI